MSATNDAPTQSRLGFSIDADQIVFEIDETLYPLDALYGACYLFVDRCFVYLSRPRPQVVGVRLTARQPSSPAELDALAGELANELLSQSLRLRLAQSTARIREYYTAAALRAAAATSSPSIDELLKELEDEEIGDDPLEIMVPWEEKHGTKEGGKEPK